MLKTCWVEPGEGATVGELVGAMGGLPPGFAAGGTRTSLAIVGEGKVMFDAYDRIRAIEALERVGVRVDGEIVIATTMATVEKVARDLKARLVARIAEYQSQQPPPQWPELAEKLLSAAQAVVADADDHPACSESVAGETDDKVIVDAEILGELARVVREIHREAVEVIERERSRNR